MTDRFTYRWGPSRLAGLGVNLSPDQVACTETEGKAVVLVPIFDPTDESPIPLTDYREEHTKALVQPAVIDVVLNDEVTKNVELLDDKRRYVGREARTQTRQDFMDAWNNGSDWRRYGQVVSEGTQTGEEYDWLCVLDDDDPTPRFLWDAVMVDDNVAQRFLTGANAAYHHTLLPQWLEFQDIRINGFCDEDEDESKQRWARLAAEFGVSEAMSDEGYGLDIVELPQWNWEMVTPDYHLFLDEDCRRIWEDLLLRSQQSWAAYDKARGIVHNTQLYYPVHDTQINPWHPFTKVS